MLVGRCVTMVMSEIEPTGTGPRIATPSNMPWYCGNTFVVATRQRQDVNGRSFCEVVDRKQFASPEEAKATAAQRGAGFEAVGLTPWQPAFSVPAISGLKVAKEFRDPAQKANESPMVRIFEVVQR